MIPFHIGAFGYIVVLRLASKGADDIKAHHMAGPQVV